MSCDEFEVVPRLTLQRSNNLMLKKKRGKLLTSHRSTSIPLLRSRPGGLRGSWSYKTYPSRKNSRLILSYNRKGVFWERNFGRVENWSVRAFDFWSIGALEYCWIRA